MPQRKRLGECLLEASVITQEQLADALSQQKGSDKRLGQVLIELGRATEEEICQAVSQVQHIDYVDVDDTLITQEIIQLVPESLAAEYHILPLFIQDKARCDMLP